MALVSACGSSNGGGKDPVPSANASSADTSALAATTKVLAPTEVASLPAEEPKILGQWLPTKESCGAKSDIVINLTRAKLEQAFGQCSFKPQLPENGNYQGKMACSDEEGGESTQKVSLTFNDKGNLIFKDGNGSTEYQRCPKNIQYVTQF